MTRDGETPESEETQRLLMDLERELSVLVRRAFHFLWDGAAGPLDRWTYALLVRLSHEGPLRVGEVARRFGINKSTASRHLARMEEQGLVGSYTDEHDGRSVLVRVTAQGEEHLTSARTARLKPLRRVFATWSDEEQHELSRLLNQLNSELDLLNGR